MDFGIAARLHDPGSADLIVGTPGYMSPEATQGGLPTATMDVFSVGLMLAEALSGTRLIAERDPYKAMHRVAHEDLRLPETLSSEVDDKLRAVLRRALARDPALRWPSAAAFRDALQAWLAPAPPEPAVEAPGHRGGNGSGASGNATLDFLIRRMRHKSDFPAMSDSVARIQRVASGEGESIASLTSEILKDVALTNKLLRMVNTAHYSSVGGSISTVSRAVAMVGFTGIRNTAMSLVMLEHMHDKAHAGQLKEEFLRSLLAGMMASELGGDKRDSEEAFIGALFQNLGRLLAEFYFPEEARQVRGIVAAAGHAGTAQLAEASASTQVLGISFEALGLGIARTWGLPPALLSCMRKPQGEPPARAVPEGAERLRWLTLAANETADTLLRTEPEQAREQLASVARRYARTLDVTAARIEAAAVAAQHQLAQMVEAMNLQVPALSTARRLFAVAPDDDEPPTLSSTHPTLSAHALAATEPMPLPGPAAVRDSAAEMLAAGIHDVTNALVGDFKRVDVLRMILETMYRALGFRHVVFCMREVKTDSLTGRFGFGDGVDAIARAFDVPLKRSGDLFAAVCAKGADVLIADARAAHIASRMPEWYRRKVDAPTFLLLPVLINGTPLGLIYADKAEPGSVTLSEKELTLLRTLRNQAVMAFKQPG
jgi:HD-like signal output (HDOD) protein